MKFQIVSYVGAPPLRFGMTLAQVESVVGVPRKTIINKLGEMDAQYEGFSVRHSKVSGSLVEIGLLPEAHVFFEDLDLFRQRDAWRDLVLRDSSPYEYCGFIILLELGLTLTGFHDNNREQMAVTAFTKGRWEHLVARFQKYPLP
jgi:hypothetical protein